MAKKYVVRFTEEEREELLKIVKSAKVARHKRVHADLLLKADAEGEGWTDEQIAAALRVARSTVERVRKVFVEQGLEAALNRKQRATPPRQKRMDGEAQARLLAIACSRPPEGRTRWTMSLLADQLVKLEIVDSISHDTVWRTLKKTKSSRT